MLKKIRLFLRGIEADLPQAPDILFNYTEDDLRNPTIVKNSYTKTINLDDTPNNNKIFSGFWNNQFVVGSEFNPTKKMPFALYLNGDLIEEGYARLDSVTGGVNSRKYQITLFGGLGDFFYNLMYSEDDAGKRRLCDLNYGAATGSTAPEHEFDFTINRDNVALAWKSMPMSESGISSELKKWKYINFMPAYEGYPDDFDSDKVLINFRGTDLVSSVTVDTSGYTSFDGYALANMKGQHTGDEMREFRSYLQRPVIKVNKVIEACCNPENNGGYQVDLDSTFFNKDNPYWNDTWMTLPPLNSFETLNDSVLTSVTCTFGTASKGNYGFWIDYDYCNPPCQGGTPSAYYYENRNLSLSGSQYTDDNLYSVDIKFNLKINNIDEYPEVIAGTHNPPTAQGIGLNYYQGNSSQIYMSIITAQLVVYSNDGRIINGSKALCLTSYSTYLNDYPNPSNITSWDLDWGTEFIESRGRFMPVSANSHTCVWNQPLQLSIDKIPYGATVKLLIKKKKVMEQNRAYLHGAFDNLAFFGPLALTTGTTDTECYSVTNTDKLPMVVDVTSTTVEAMNADIVRTGSHFNKEKILNTDYSPADFLLSYCKMFGLYFTKDRYEKKIYIRTRNNYYLPDSIEEINDKVDRGNMEIKPVFVGTKWLDFDTEAEESASLTKYKDSFGINYGLQRINTGYDFNSDTSSLFEGSIFRGGITTLEKNESHSFFYGPNGIPDTYKPWMLEGYDYQLYVSGGIDTSTGVTYKEESTIGILQGFRGTTLKYYDLFEKLQFHDTDNSPIDGDRVLVFYNGNQLPYADGTGDDILKYWITDDNYDMMLLNDSKPCWFWTLSSKNQANKDVAVMVSQNNSSGIPMYSRYKYYNGTNNIAKSLDFGTPKQLFNPLASIDSGSSLYAQYWENFVKDLYSADTRVVTTKIPLPDNFSEEDMRKFYHFDGNIWRLNAVSEHNIANYEPTKVEFVKVQDTDNYQLNVDYSLDWFEMSSPKSLDNYYVIPYNNSQEIPVEIKPKSSDVSYNISLKVNNQTIADYGSFTGTTNLDISSSLTNVTTDFLIEATADNNASSSLNFHKNGMKVTTIVDGDTIPASGNARLKIWVWFEDSATHGDQWRATSNYSVFWTKGAGTSTNGGIDLSTDYCEANVPANNTGHEIKWVFTIHMQSSSGDMTIVTFTQPSM